MKAVLSMSEAIAAHQAAYAADDALYGEDGEPITSDNAVVETANDLEIETFRSFAKLSCRSHDDVQAKLAYVFSGVAAHQQGIFSALSDDGYADEEYQGLGECRLLEECIRSLRLGANG